MAKEVDCFKNEYGEAAFLTGVVDSLSDEMLSRVCPRHSTVEVDIFYLGENKEIDFNSAVRSRLYHYLPSIAGDETKLKAKIDSLDIQFKAEERYKDFQTPGFIMDLFRCMPDYQHGADQHKAYCRFSEAIEYYLGKPLRFYSTDSGYSLLPEFYLHTCYGVAFIEYDRYLLMIMTGLSE